MYFPEHEAAVIEAVTAQDPKRHQVHEVFAAHLLADLAGLSPRATDGLILLREEARPTRYFAVGRVFLLANQMAEPVWFEFAFGQGARVFTSGQMHSG
jgi:hypothetical protein